MCVYPSVKPFGFALCFRRIAAFRAAAFTRGELHTAAPADPPESVRAIAGSVPIESAVGAKLLCVLSAGGPAAAGERPEKARRMDSEARRSLSSCASFFSIDARSSSISRACDSTRVEIASTAGCIPHSPLHKKKEGN